MTTTDASTAPDKPAVVGACPRCGAPVGALQPAATATGPSCPRCRLPLSGPLVAELSDLNRRHAELGRYRSDVLARVTADLAANERRRAELLVTLGSTGPTPTAVAQHTNPAGTRPAGGGNGRGTQTLLLGLGVLCLAIAVAVFAAVGWGRLNPAGQAAVLVAATVAAGLGGLGLHRRGLRATGEAVLCLAAAIMLVDVAVFGDALGAGTGDLRFWSGGLALLAGLGAAPRRWGAGDAEPPLAGALIGVVAAQLTLPLAMAAALGARSGTGFHLTIWDPRLTQAGIAGVAVVGIVQAIVVTLVTRQRRWNPATPLVAVGLLTAASGWLVSAFMALALAEPTATAAVLAAAAIAAALAASLPQLHSAWTNLAAAGAVATALGAWTALAPDALSPTVWVAIGAALALLVALIGPHRSRVGGALTAAVVLAGTTWVLLAAAGYALEYFAELVGGTPGAALGDAGHSWAEVLAVAVIIAGSGCGAVGIAARRHDRRAWAVRLAAIAVALVGYLAVALPPMIGLGQAVWAIVLAGAAIVGGLLAVTVASGVAVRATGWAVATTTAAAALALAYVGDDLWLWWVLVAIVAALAVLTGRTGRTGEGAALAGTAALLTIGGAASTAALLHDGAPWAAMTAVTTSGILAVAAAGIVCASDATSSSTRASRSGPEQAWKHMADTVIAVALGAQAVALIVAVADAIDSQAAVFGTTNLLIAAFGWFAVAVLTRRGLAAAVGAVLTQCAAWLALGIVGVGLVEAYTVPGSLVLLALGVEAMRRSPSQSSWASLSPALLFALVPSSILALGDGGPRVLVLIATGTLLVVAGAALRLGAPVVVGACVVVTLSLVELAPLIGSLPRYLTFGVAGAVLLITGATFERRRAELATLQRQLRALR